MPKNKDNSVDVIDTLCDFAQVMKDAVKEDMLANNPDYIEKITSLKKKKSNIVWS